MAINNNQDDPQSNITGELTARLVEDVERLATYAVQTDKLPEQIDVGMVFAICSHWSKTDSITPAQLTVLTHAYQLLERRFPTITARTLAATEPVRPGKALTSPVGHYLLKLWIWTGIIVLAILISNLIQYIHGATMEPPGEEWTNRIWARNLGLEITKYLEPFLYGALGSFVYLLRISESLLHTREFDPSRAPEHINRLVLGSLSGGTIILFIANVPLEGGKYLEISGAALGFLAGYSVDFLVETLDRIIKAILPKVGLDSIQRGAQEKRRQEMLRRYNKMLDEATTDEQKKILKEIISDVQAR